MLCSRAVFCRAHSLTCTKQCELTCTCVCVRVHATAFPVAEALLENKSLSSLSLEHNSLTSDGTNFAGLETLCRALSVNTTLTSLNLFGCGLAAEVRIS